MTLAIWLATSIILLLCGANRTNELSFWVALVPLGFMVWLCGAFVWKAFGGA